MILGLAMAAGFAVSFLPPAIALFGMAALLVRFRSAATDFIWRLSEAAAQESPPGWRPGRNLCRALVWGTAISFLAVGVSLV